MNNLTAACLNLLAAIVYVAAAIYGENTFQKICYGGGACFLFSAAYWQLQAWQIRRGRK